MPDLGAVNLQVPTAVSQGLGLHLFPSRNTGASPCRIPNPLFFSVTVVGQFNIHLKIVKLGSHYDLNKSILSPEFHFMCFMLLFQIHACDWKCKKKFAWA